MVGLYSTCHTFSCKRYVNLNMIATIETADNLTDIDVRENLERLFKFDCNLHLPHKLVDSTNFLQGGLLFKFDYNLTDCEVFEKYVVSTDRFH